MARKAFDPLQFIPSPETIREELAQAESLAHRLRVLLDLAERLRLPLTTGNTVITPAERVEVSRV